MSVQELYDDTCPELWKQVIGEDLHYHVGWGEGDILHNAVEHLYQFIDIKSKVLDCGCGWGGPAKAIKKDLNCDVKGITNSPVQFEYIKDNLHIDVVLCDLHDYHPSETFDSAIFIESFCHLKDPKRVIENIKNHCNKIILREYVLIEKNYPRKYLDNWLMTIYYKEEIISLFERQGYKVVYQEDHYKNALEPTLNYWLSNLGKIDQEDKTFHIKLLEKSARYLKLNLKDVLNSIELSTLVFKK